MLKLLFLLSFALTVYSQCGVSGGCNSYWEGLCSDNVQCQTLTNGYGNLGTTTCPSWVSNTDGDLDSSTNDECGWGAGLCASGGSPTAEFNQSNPCFVGPYCSGNNAHYPWCVGFQLVQFLTTPGYNASIPPSTIFVFEVTNYCSAPVFEIFIGGSDFSYQNNTNPCCQPTGNPPTPSCSSKNLKSDYILCSGAGTTLGAPVTTNPNSPGCCPSGYSNPLGNSCPIDCSMPQYIITQPSGGLWLGYWVPGCQIGTLPSQFSSSFGLYLTYGINNENEATNSSSAPLADNFFNSPGEGPWTETIVLTVYNYNPTQEWFLLAHGNSFYDSYTVDTFQGCLCTDCDTTTGPGESTIQPCALGYPTTTSYPRTSVLFNEPAVLDSFAYGNGRLQMFFSDEHVMTLGVSELITASGSQFTSSTFQSGSSGPSCLNFTDNSGTFHIEYFGYPLPYAVDAATCPTWTNSDNAFIGSNSPCAVNDTQRYLIEWVHILKVIPLLI